ncbi:MULTISPECIES: asparagine synthetase B family protein [Limnospira]|uniref:asparagine synthase (glutamine-hydrolyzing) n=2 Tax=Limnospira TaxID=2596745 RepID=B5VUJ3_LIMMA|nr:MULTISPECIES: asparagine synthase-related protein [Limnospira]EKD10335.1 asparagine synthase (glutamine-hydrolyzing) [Arthrospira platensis C1]MDC0836840.1 asparagine synthase-related protein [Limnoraphis robusta]MDY7052191.1 asparagine synthase-related protein [Limnospira fusiformis LS22]QJB28425.1 asparagine synthetase B [Limnospira fusiformis SAG 85.79]EDZ97209.1 Asparagine synthase (glutamine-hydrolyzing) [Limnospira maxima CS-328]
MCGIAVIFGEQADRKKAELSRMLETMKSRGEVTETFFHPQVAAGTRRLKIVDREASKQPIFNATGDKLIVFNGEIFNFAALRSELQDKYTFQTNGDTETILYAFEEYGENCLNLFEGQFTFAIIDLSKNQVFFARDPVGIIPLYYVRDRDFLYLASTIKALTFLNRPIQVLSPGCLEWSDRPELPYFRPQFKPSPPQLSEFLPQLKTTITSAIRSRTQTDLPLGVIYSGGLDSSIVLSQAIQNHPQVTAFTVGCEGSEDVDISRRFCRERGIKQVVISLHPKDISLEEIKVAIRESELTEYGDIINAVISLQLFRKIREYGIKVVLAGDGSDELFGGYEMYSLDLSEPERQNLFFYKLMNLHRTELQRVDRCSMAWGVETRVPFLATPVIDLALNTPQAWKIKDGIEKWCLRQAFQDELPEYIIKRRKNPLSHSSGLHEWVRRYKWFFRENYDRQGYRLHDHLKKDFSAILRENNYQIDRAIAATQFSPDYSRLELLLEGVKASLRTGLFQWRSLLTNSQIKS